MKIRQFALMAFGCLFVAALIPSSAAADQLHRKQVTVLQSAPDTPFIPQYTGQNAHFDKAFKTVHTKDGLVSLDIYMSAREKPEQVIDWYRSVLKQYGWSLDGFDSNISNSITANRLSDGKQCTVQVNPDDAQPGYKTRVVISYQLFQPMTDVDSDQQQRKPNASTIAGNAAIQPR